VYNGEDHVGAAIASVLGQTFRDLRLIISDNASTDATGEICKEFAEADDRVDYSRQPTNIGARANFHHVFHQAGAHSPYFKWHGHDDGMQPTFIERCVEHLDRHPDTVLCQSRFEIVDGDDRSLGAGPPPIAFSARSPHERMHALFAAPKTHQTLFGLHRRDVLARTGLFGPWFSSDRALLIELSLYGNFGLVDEQLFVHREHPGRGDYVEDKVDWYTPERNGRAEVVYWPHLRATTRILATTPMPWAERMRCVGELARRGRGIVTNWAPMLGHEAVAIAVKRLAAARAHPDDL
jgi:glycosyltransferase involved in cell wall biosynthesis